MTYCLGLDVGGTNTDAVILDLENAVLAKSKQATTTDISTGIKNAIKAVLRDSGVHPGTIKHAMLGTTHSTNAIVERKNLARVGVIRLCLPGGKVIPPAIDWPSDLLEHVGQNYVMVKGGYEFNGKPISELDEQEIRTALKELKEKKIEALAISGVFSSVNAEQEKRVKAIAKEVLGPKIPISLSGEIGSIGLLERENATVLNAAISFLAEKAYGGFQNVLREHGILADMFITQNDGTLMSVEYAKKYPVFTIASGPTNSLRGAAFLSGKKDCIVVDVGGTTTDVGILKNGFPRESSSAVEIGGVRTNFRMPDLIAVGLGGGSKVRIEAGQYKIGPDSVGFKIREEAFIFGGSTLTATDIAVASGRYDLGDKDSVQNLSTESIEAANQVMKKMVERVIDSMKFSAEDMPVVLVGGGSILLPQEFEGASDVSRPENFDVANAIGAAISQISGSIDSVFDVASKGREAVVEEVKEAAKQEAIRAGADEETVEIVELEDIPLAYLPSNAVRFKAKAVGHLKLSP